MRRGFDPSAPTSPNNQLYTLKRLLAYLWPAGRTDLKVRLVLALGFLLGAKGITVYAPFFYADAVDGLSGAAEIVAVPILLIVAFGVAKFFVAAFGEFRDALFVPVQQNAIRKVALSTFRHLHGLSLRFHTDRQTVTSQGAPARSDRSTVPPDFSLYQYWYPPAPQQESA